MNTHAIADLVLCLSSTFYCLALFPQIIKIHRLKNASQFSWGFLTIISFALIAAVTAKAMLGLVGASIADGIQIFEYVILIYQKVHYSKIIVQNNIFPV